MPAVYIHSHTVQDRELDGVGHVNNLSYVAWLLDAAIAHASAQGWPAQRHLEQGSGWVVKSHYIEYRRPAYAGDEIQVLTWVSSFKRVSSVRRYRVVRVRDGAILAAGETNWAYVDFKSHAPLRIPPEVASAFEIVPPEAEPRDQPLSG